MYARRPPKFFSLYQQHFCCRRAPKTSNAAQRCVLFGHQFHNFQNAGTTMRKSQIVDLLSRRLGVRATRLTNLVQRLAEAGLLQITKGPPYASPTPAEIARMVLIAICDDGLGSAPATAAKFGGLLGPGSNLEQALGHALMRPESLAPSCSSLEIHTSDEPYAILTTVTADGARSLVFGEMPDVESVDRTVLISGAALFAIASEIAGVSGADVDALLGAKPAASAVN
jgi:hypothetical protein